MRKPIAILFALLLLVQSGGYLLFFKAEQHHIQHEVREVIFNSIPDSQCTIITWSESAKSFLGVDAQFENDHEIRADGIIYDIVREVKLGDVIHYHCYADHQESQLMSHLDQLIKNNTRQNQNTLQHSHLLQLLVQPYCGTNFAFNPILPQDSNGPFANYLFPIKSWIDLPEDPPPKIH